MSDDAKLTAFDEWLEGRPQAVQDAARAYPPWEMYRLKETGQHAQVKSYSESEDGRCTTCTIIAWRPEFPELTCVEVFGVHLTSLEPIPFP